jgi:pyruvate/2-oxoglutarate dehydrogenase complex dihydrolipoamide acyltransferase (E2) component
MTVSVDRLVPIDGKPAVRPMMAVTLSGDHRVVDGARAAEFLRDVALRCILQPRR